MTEIAKIVDQLIQARDQRIERAILELMRSGAYRDSIRIEYSPYGGFTIVKDLYTGNARVIEN